MKTTNKIKEVRELRGMNQTELARRIGTTASTISRLEDGKRRLSEMYLTPIAKALGVTPGELIGGEIQTVSPEMQIPVVGQCGYNLWGVHVDLVEDVRLPVVPQASKASLDHSAYMVMDDHASSLLPKSGYVICVPLRSARQRPLEGDIVLVRSTEGRMERHVVAKVEIDNHGPLFLVEGQDAQRFDDDNIPVGLVVATYLEL